MKKYYSLFRIRLLDRIQYRVIAFGIVLSNFIWVYMELMMYVAIYQSTDKTLPMSFPQIVSYVWIKRMAMQMLAVVAADNEIYSVINDGSIAYELVRPIDLYGKWYFQAMSNRLTSILVSCLPILVIAFLLPDPFKLCLPISILQFVEFLVALILALGVVVAFAMLMFITLFYTIAQRGIKIIVTATVSFLSGGIIPLTFFPEQLKAILYALPFSSMQSTPLLIYSGNLIGKDALIAIGFQIFWLIILFLLGKVLMTYSLKKVIAQGG